MKIYVLTNALLNDCFSDEERVKDVIRRLKH
jgi:hypothetical protein